MNTKEASLTYPLFASCGVAWFLGHRLVLVQGFEGLGAYFDMSSYYKIQETRKEQRYLHSSLE